MKYTLMLLAILTTSDCYSKELLIHIGSSHSVEQYAPGKEFNEDNAGIGYKLDNLRFGVYNNSYHKTTVYAGYDAHTSGKYFQLGLQAGIASGYQGTPQGRGELTVFALPYVAIGSERVKAEIGYLPPVNGVGVITMTLRVGL